MTDKWVRPSKDWEITYIGKSDYVITLKDKYIEMTGANVITEFGILKGHILKKVELKHTDSAKAESTDNLTITLQRRMELLDALLIDLFEEAAGTTKSDKRILFGANYEYPSQYYRLVLNTTNTDRVYIEVYVEVLPKLVEPAISELEVIINQESITKLAEAIAQLIANRRVDP